MNVSGWFLSQRLMTPRRVWFDGIGAFFIGLLVLLLMVRIGIVAKSRCLPKLRVHITVVVFGFEAHQPQGPK